MREICKPRKGPEQSSRAPFVFVQGGCSTTNKNPALTNSKEEPFIGAELDESKLVFEHLSVFEVIPSFTQSESRMGASGLKACAMPPTHVQAINISGRQVLSGYRILVAAPFQCRRATKIGTEEAEHPRPRFWRGHRVLGQARVYNPCVHGPRQGRGQVMKSLSIGLSELLPVELSSIEGLGEVSAARGHDRRQTTTRAHVRLVVRQGSSGWGG
jgi:hypothetical protein